MPGAALRSPVLSEVFSSLEPLCEDRERESPHPDKYIGELRTDKMHYQEE